MGNALWRWNILVLAVEVVLSAELARACFVALLFAGSAVVAGLSGPHLLSSHLLSACILSHVRALCIGINGLAILLAGRRRRRVEDGAIGVGGADGVAVAIGDVAVGAVLWIHGPWTLMSAMLHALGRSLDVDADADAGARAVGLRRRDGGLRRGRGTVGGDAVLRDCYRSGTSSGAMRAMTR
jgi:hypothetical protein